MPLSSFSIMRVSHSAHYFSMHSDSLSWLPTEKRGAIIPCVLIAKCHSTDVFGNYQETSSNYNKQ